MKYLLASSNNASGDIWMTIIYMVIILGIFYLLLILPQNKKRKKEDKMRSNIQIGDNITTIGGIVGKVVGIKEDSSIFVIETGTDRSKIQIKKWAVSSVETVHDDAG
ncbi:MAG TPA: preprotein translocase subunit YajC [Ruminococcaceae bacterium]|jgi:preprotein translocase subunit YajC|nr:preprotein translocase subunit YajC [Oscillospiraceae bacterium]